MMKQLKKCDNDKTITYKLKFIDSFRFMRASLSSLVDNFSEIAKIDCIKCKEKKKLNQNVILLSLKIINYTTNVKNVKKHG